MHDVRDYGDGQQRDKKKGMEGGKQMYRIPRERRWRGGGHAALRFVDTCRSHFHLLTAAPIVHFPISRIDLSIDKSSEDSLSRVDAVKQANQHNPPKPRLACSRLLSCFLLSCAQHTCTRLSAHLSPNSPYANLRSSCTRCPALRIPGAEPPVPLRLVLGDQHLHLDRLFQGVGCAR